MFLVCILMSLSENDKTNEAFSWTWKSEYYQGSTTKMNDVDEQLTISKGENVNISKGLKQK